MYKKVFEKARVFVYKNARPLDLARWKYHFEDGSKEDVLKVLSCYQNEDGGFGHGIEADLWNIHSTPIATSTAIEILKEIEFYDNSNDIVKGILEYLEKTPHQEERGWLLKIPSNNEYPHSNWWKYSKETEIGFSGEWEYNPTAILAGFVLKTAEKESAVYKKAEQIVIQAIDVIKENGSVEMHEAKCFCTLLELLQIANIDKCMIDIVTLKKYLKIAVNNAIEKDVSRWSGYCAKPSQYFNSKNSIFYLDNKETAECERDYIVKEQLTDGSYPVSWRWGTEYKEFEIAANWWKSDLIIKNMLYLKGMGK